ncbi:hypothetical protein HaLaN_33131, partial [Haematococcus lacustris]
AWDTFLYVFEGPPETCSANPGTSAELTNDDDSSSCGELQSRVNFTALPGITYYVVVEPYSSGSGSAALSIVSV